MNLLTSSSALACLLNILLFVFQSQAFAANQLSAKTVENWIASQKAFATWGDQHAEILEAFESEAPKFDNPLAITAKSMIEPIAATGLKESAEALVRPYGFSSLEQWAEITLKITRTAAAIQVETQKQSLDTSKLEALQQSGRLSPEENEMIARAIQQNKDMLNYLETSISEEDKALVRPFLPQLENLLNEN